MQRTKKILSKIKPVSFLELHTIHSQCSYVCKDRKQDQFSLLHVYSSLLQGKWTKLVKEKECRTAGKQHTENFILGVPCFHIPCTSPLLF